MITEFAAAKINLALHVTGKREDGYHLLDSAVMFAREIGDTLEVAPADHDTFSVSGPFRKDLEAESGNLVLRALEIVRARFPDQVQPCAMILHKNLPVASGIGGGSADAAAALRAVARLNALPVDHAGLASLGLALGADVPVCISSTACRMRGIGEITDNWTNPPKLYAVLVNPLIGVSTAGIFSRLGLSPGSIEGAGMPDNFDQGSAMDAAVHWLSGCRNDLQPAARQLQPAISDVLLALEQLPQCRLSRMSGSGATCFGLFTSAEDARAGADIITMQNDQWWVAATELV